MKPLRIDTFRAFFYSLAIHCMAAGLLVLSVDFGSFRVPPPAAPTKVVQAVAVDQREVEAEIARIREREEQARREQAERERKLRDELEQAKQAREAEERRLAKVKQEREAIARRKREEEQRLKEAELKRKRDEQARLEAEAQHKRKEEEARKQAEAEKRKQAEEQRKREEALRQQELLDAIAAEERETARVQQDARDQDLIDRYIRQIRQKIENAFINPVPQSKLSCVIRIRMIPGGEVVSASIEQSSGNPAFDRQAAVAVEKASPLPVPDDPRLFNKFRELPIFFNPTQ